MPAHIRIPLHTVHELMIDHTNTALTCCCSQKLRCPASKIQALLVMTQAGDRGAEELLRRAFCFHRAASFSFARFSIRTLCSIIFRFWGTSRHVAVSKLAYIYTSESACMCVHPCMMHAYAAHTNT